MIALHRALNQPRNDIIAIAIETGIQNTGMSIFILWFTLDHPLGDITGELYFLHPLPKYLTKMPVKTCVSFSCHRSKLLTL